MCPSQSVGSYGRTGEVSRMKLQKGHEDLYKRAKRAFFLLLARWKKKQYDSWVYGSMLRSRSK